MANMLELGCPYCGGPTAIVSTKSKTGVAQYAVGCPIHGRVQANWYTSSASATTTALLSKTAKKTKWAAPV